ncbi:hypothetical protein, partial [Conchiformibius steedae]|uniref:hypothetical protein n=1 Tax=Conchiformibius steedae TaxID=153493 RepID=UPI0026EBF743
PLPSSPHCEPMTTMFCAIGLVAFKNNQGLENIVENKNKAAMPYCCHFNQLLIVTECKTADIPVLHHFPQVSR